MPLELIVGAAVGAAAASEKIRKAVRKGMIYGLGGLLVAYDKAVAMGHEAAQGARRGVAAAASATAAAVAPAPAAPSAAAPNSPPAGASLRQDPAQTAAPSP
jgi:hypothetical protein